MPKKTNVTINENKYFKVTKTIGKTADGRPIKKQFYGSSKKAAEQKRDEFVNAVRIHGLRVDYKEMTVSELIKIWLFEVVKQDKSHNTFDRYETVFRNYILKSPVAGLKVYEVQHLTLQTHYNNMRKDGYSESQVYHFNKLLKSFFNYALTESYVSRNPCIGIKVSRKSPRINEDKNENIDPFTDEEIKLIQSTAQGSMFVVFQLALGTGLRRGELLGLRIKDLNLEDKELQVNVALKRVKEFTDKSEYRYVTIIDGTKTEGSKRIIPIPHPLMPMLEQHLHAEKEKHKDLGITHNDNNLLFTSETGTPYCGKNILTAFKRLLKRANVRYRSFHNLRHTFATKLFEQGENILVISKLLGHASTVITANVYISIMPKEKTNAAEKLNYLFQ